MNDNLNLAQMIWLLDTTCELNLSLKVLHCLNQQLMHSALWIWSKKKSVHNVHNTCLLADSHCMLFRMLCFVLMQCLNQTSHTSKLHLANKWMSKLKTNKKHCYSKKKNILRCTQYQYTTSDLFSCHAGMSQHYVWCVVLCTSHCCVILMLFKSVGHKNLFHQHEIGSILKKYLQWKFKITPVGLSHAFCQALLLEVW